MGHRDKKVKLGRTASHRDAMLGNMAMSLFLHRTIKTTEAKAKALAPVIDRLIVTAKENTLASKRQVARTIRQKDVFKKLYDEILPHFSDRNSGFTRIFKLGFRRGDNAPVSMVELLTPRPVAAIEAPEKGKKADAKSAAAPQAAAAPKKAKAAAATPKKAAAKKAAVKKTAKKAGAK